MELERDEKGAVAMLSCFHNPMLIASLDFSKESVNHKVTSSLDKKNFIC